MDLIIFSKTLLNVYNYLETITKAIEKLVNASVVNTCYRCGYRNSTIEQSNKLIDILDKKQKLINLKVICENALLELDDEDKKILCLYYFDNLKAEKIASLFDICSRTVFRKKQKAIQNFSFRLLANGYDLDYFKKRYGDEKWLSDLYCYTRESEIKEQREIEICGNAKSCNLSSDEISESNIGRDDSSKGKIIMKLLGDIKREMGCKKVAVCFDY